MTNESQIVVIGEALIDRFPDGDVIGGAPFNVARALAAFGASPLMITRVGNDGDAELVRAEFKRFGLSEAALQIDPARPTGLVRVHLTADGHRFEIGANQAWDALDADSACAAIATVNAAAICFGTLAQREETSRSAIHAALRAVAATKVLDLNLRASGNTPQIAEASLNVADIVKVNDDELLQLFRWFITPSTADLRWGTPSFVAATKSLMAQFQLQTLVVTRGAEGYAAFGNNGVLVAEGKSPAVDVVDTVGAGDSFLAVLLMGHTRAWPLAATLARANAFAARVCTLRGAVTDLDFYRREQAAWKTETVL